MAYRLKRSDTSLTDTVRRITREQLDKAVAGIDGTGPRAAVVHDVRKRLKKLRALVRLVRPGFPGYADANAWFRDTARPLSPLRDAAVLIRTYDDVLDRFEAQVERRAFASIRRRLTLRHQALADDTGAVAEALAGARRRLCAARERASDWRLDDEGWSPVGAGLEKTYRRARAARDAAGDEPSDERLHEWRKRVKYHWYHLRLVRPIWPGPLGAAGDEAHRLADLLGDDHDRAVFRATLLAEPDAFGDARDVDACVALVDRDRCGQQAEAFALGRRVLAESASELGARLRAYWQAWRESPPTAVPGATAP